MSHVFTLALVYALVVMAAGLWHAAAAGWAASRAATLEPAILVGAPVAAALGMALAANAVTTGVGRMPELLAWSAAHEWLGAVGWLGGPVLLLLALLLQEASRHGRIWRAMGANAPGLVVAGVRFGLVLPTLLGLGLAVLAGHLAPPPAISDWLPLACLALLAVARPDRPKGRATLTVLVAWLAGALVGGLELLVGPPLDILVIAAATLLAVRLAGPRLVHRGIG